MTPKQIKSRIKEKGLSQRAIAKRLKRSQTAVHFMIYGRLKSARLEKRFANLLGLTVEEFRGKAA